jgi:hypothetical protein
MPRMWVAAAEFLTWATFGLLLGVAMHWWKAHADPYPDVMDKDDPGLNLALGEYKIENYLADSEYDDVGFWEYYSVRNLLFYVSIGVTAVLGPVYATAAGHAHARDTLCSIAGAIRLNPIFCGSF